MPAKREPAKEPPKRKEPTATNSHDREQQMIALADKFAEEAMLAGTASSQIVTEYLKRGSSRELLEQEKLANENLRIQAQIEQLKSTQRTEELMVEVLAAIKLYNGVDDDE